MADSITVSAEVAVEPIVEGEAHAEAIAGAVEALRGPGLDVQPGGMSTTVTGELDEVLHAVQRAHAATAGAVERVVTTVRLESKRGGEDLTGRREEVAEQRRE